MGDELYVVGSNGLVASESGLPDDEIIAMLDSGYFSAAFRIVDEVMVYADVDYLTNTVEWKAVEQLQED